MKKAVKIIAVIVLVLFIIVNIPAVALYFIFPMPDDAKDDSVCFLAPELTWNSTIADVRDCFGEPVESVNEECDALFGEIKTDTFSTMFEDYPMKVKVTRRGFSAFTLFRRKRVFEYTFNIKCSDAQKEKTVFDSLCEKLIGSKVADKHFYYDKEDNVLFASTYYGPIWLECGIKYQIEYNRGITDEVVFNVISPFDI